MTLVLAHRGARRVAPENTVDAFVRAIGMGAHGVELDVHRSRDGALLVCHDAETGSGLIDEMTRAEVRAALPAVGLLDDALDACAGAGALVNVEVKSAPARDGRRDSLSTGIRAAEALVVLLHARGGTDRVVVSSFDLAAIDRTRALDPSIETALLVVGDPFDALHRARAHGHGGLHPHIASLHGGRARELIELAHGHDVAVRAWTVNESADLARLATCGIDAVITDVPDVARRVLDGHELP